MVTLQPAVDVLHLSAALITTLFQLSVGVGDKMAKELKSYGANIRVAPKSEGILHQAGGVAHNPLNDRDFLDERDLVKIKDIFWRNNILGLAPSLKAMVVLDSAETTRAPLIGTYFDKNLPVPDDELYRTGVRTTGSTFWKVDGRWPDDEATDEALVGVSLATARGIGIGQILHVARPGRLEAPLVLRVVGIVSTGSAEDTAIVAPLAVAQELTGLEHRA